MAALAALDADLYTVCPSSIVALIVNRQEWIARCSARLQAQWPRVPREQLIEVAAELRREHECQESQPERAASAWLALGIPDHVESGADADGR
jgi:hypothetical protein